MARVVIPKGKAKKDMEKRKKEEKKRRSSRLTKPNGDIALVPNGVIHKSPDSTIRRRSERLSHPKPVPLPIKKAESKSPKILGKIHRKKKAPAKKFKKAPKRKEKRQQKEDKKKPSKRPLDKKTKAASKKGNDRLKPRDGIPAFRENPLIFGKRPEEYTSWRSLYLRLLWAINKQDMKEIKAILEDKRMTYKVVCNCFSFLDFRCVFVEAIASGNEKLWTLVLSKIKQIAEETRSDQKEPNLLERKATGRRNFYMLGRATRNIESVRGGREGNNAFLRYEAPAVNNDGILKQLFSRGIDFSTLTVISAKADKLATSYCVINHDDLQSKVVTMVRMGNRKLASAVAHDFKHHFNQLHLETLKEKGKLPERILPISVRKKAFMNRNMTPAHTAAINPDPSFLQRLRQVDPAINHPDQDDWYTTHYAAVCEGDGPLLFLLSNNIGVQDVNKRGEYPIHVAARVGRHKNVKILIDAITNLENISKTEEKKDEVEEEEEGEEDLGPRAKRKKLNKPLKEGVSILNAKTRYGRTPLHLAASYGRTETVRQLLRSDKVDREAKTSPNDKSMTALMLAAGAGHLDTCIALIDGGCLVEGRDKLKRSPLMIAVINGQLHIVADLLRRGADVNRKDSSANTALHYACAYGWLDIAQLLADVESTTVTAKNDWQLTPLSVAYLKGHYGIVNWLLEGPHKDLVDINCKDNEGVTMLSSLIAFHDVSSTQHLPNQIDFLIKHGASAAILDTDDNNPLHALAGVPIKLKVEPKQGTDVPKDNDSRTSAKEYKECVEMLLRAGASILQTNKNGQTPFSVALGCGNLFLAEYLFNKESAKLLEELQKDEMSTKTGQNLLHLLFQLPFHVLRNRDVWGNENSPMGGQYNVIPFFNKIRDEIDVNSVLLQPDSEGVTPILQLALAIAKECNANCRGKGNPLAPFVSTQEALLKQCLRLCPSSVLARKELSGEQIVSLGERGVLEQPCLIKTILDSLPGNNYDFLHLVLECATSAGLLAELLEDRFMHSTLAMDALLYCLGTGKTAESIIILDAAFEANISNSVHQTEFATRQDPATGKVIEWKKSALLVAVENGLVDVLKHFRLSPQQAGKADANGYNAFHYAARKLNEKTISMFEAIDKLGVPFQDPPSQKGETPLHIAVNAEKTGSADALLDPIEWLLQKGLPSGHQDKNGRTVLHYVLEKNEEFDCKQTAKRDPIALLSLILGSMNGRQQIDLADVNGDTALHLAARVDANICAVTLLDNLLDVEIDPLNKDGNSPLALAMFHKNQAVALTLIQAGAQILGPVNGPVPEKKEEEVVLDKPWKFAASPVKTLVRFESTIPFVVVRNEWHSLVYVILDKLGKVVPSRAVLKENARTVSSLVAAALQNSQHNFALYLLKLLGPKTTQVTAAVAEHDPLMLFTESLPASTSDLSVAATSVLDKLLCLDIAFRPAIVEKAILRGCYRLLTLLKTADPARWTRLAPSSAGRSVLSAVFSRWIECPQEEKLLSVLLNDLRSLPAFSSSALDEPVLAPKRALPGMAEPAEPRVEELLPPIVWAIQAQCPGLVLYLVKSGANVNTKEAEYSIPPLSHALITNNYDIIKVLIDGEVPPPENEVNESKRPSTANNKPRTMVFGKRSYTVSARAVKKTRLSEESGSDEDDTSEADSEDEEEEEKNEQGNLTIKKIDLHGKNKDLDLAAKDAFGRNVFHFLVAPCGYQNIGLLNAIASLVKSKAKKLLAEKEWKKSPVELAAEQGQMALLGAMRTIDPSLVAALPKSADKVPSERTENVDIDVDSAAFCSAFLAKKNSEKKVDEEKERIPNKNSGYDKTGVVIFCEETKQIFKILLNKTDMRGGTYAFHNYYRMELIKRRDSDLFILFTNWGRIGDSTGEYQCTPFKSLEGAIKEWRSVWRQKTGNDWAPFQRFDEKPGKYRLVQTEDRVSSLADVELEKFELAESDKNDRRLRFIFDISHVGMLKDYAKQVELNGRKYNCPFGRISLDDLEKAARIIEDLKGVQKEKQSVLSKRPINSEKLLKLYDDERQLTSAFYTAIPIGGYEKCALEVISDERMINAADGMLKQLSDIEIAGRFIMAAAHRRNTVDPLRYLLSAVSWSCSIVPLAETDEVSQRVLQWVRSSKPSQKVCGLLKICPRNRSDEFHAKHSACLNTTYLLHGTKAANMLSILHGGLVATPANALECGQAYGKGVYFADVFDKSAGYCGPSDSALNYMFVCKVAIGRLLDSNEPWNEKSKFDTLAVYGQRYPDPSSSITIDGACMPLGPLVRGQRGVSRAWWDWSEFIVKDHSRILTSYIIIFKN